MSEKQHFRLSASGSACWTTCTAAPGYVASLNLPPDKGSIYAEEGTKAHDYAEKILRHLLLDGPLFTLEDIPDDTWPQHLQDDYLQCVADYVERCCEVARVPGQVFVEESVQLFYAPNDPTAKGTCDFCHISDDGKVVTIRDLKAGAGVPVSAVENTQLAIYALSFIHESDRVFNGETTVVIEIDQPRGYGGDGPVSRWTLSASELKQFCNHIMEAVEKIESGDVQFNPSEKACRWCRGKSLCPARNESLEVLPVNVLDGLEPVALERQSVTVEQLVQIYKHSATIKKICDDAEEFLTELARQGNTPEGVKLVEGRKGNRKWVDSTKVERMLARAGIKEKERFKFTLKSPSDVADLPQVKGDEKLQAKIEKLITRAPGQPKLALADDPRPAINLTAGLEPVLELEDVLG